MTFKTRMSPISLARPMTWKLRASSLTRTWQLLEGYLEFFRIGAMSNRTCSPRELKAARARAWRWQFLTENASLRDCCRTRCSTAISVARWWLSRCARRRKITSKRRRLWNLGSGPRFPSDRHLCFFSNYLNMLF